MEHAPETERRIAADTVYIVDLDRCLINTSLAQTMLETAAHEVAGIHPMRLQAECLAEEQAGNSFDTLRALKKYVDNPHVMRQIEERFCEDAVSRHGSYLLREDGADELLALFQANQAHFFIMTYGGPDWQRLKLRASGLDGYPRLITDDRRKGYRIEEAFDEGEGRYVFPDVIPGRRLVGSRVCLIDDKAVSFEGLDHERTWGLQVLSINGDVLVSQTGHLEPNIIAVRGLRNATLRLMSSAGIDKS